MKLRLLPAKMRPDSGGTVLEQAKRRQWLLLGIAAGAALAAILVIPLAVMMDNRLGTDDPAEVGVEAPSEDSQGADFDPAAAAQGETLYTSCIACHGADATGVTGLGKTLIGSDFVNGTSDADLVAFLKVGRSTSDPANTTGVDMPPKGGNPALSDDDLGFIVAYLRSLN